MTLPLTTLPLTTLPFTTSHAEWLGLVVGVVSLVGIGGIVANLVCHRSGCFRWGRFRHGHYRLCHVHHPSVPSDGRITEEHIAAIQPGPRQREDRQRAAILAGD
jgi:hypothetical protein